MVSAANVLACVHDWLDSACAFKVPFVYPLISQVSTSLYCAQWHGVLVTCLCPSDEVPLC